MWKILFVSTVTALVSLSSFAQADQPKTEYRELKCAVRFEDSHGPMQYQEEPNLEIPEDAFNYTSGMQTFWLPLTATYQDPRTQLTHRVDISIAMNKIGRQSTISYISVKAALFNQKISQFSGEIHGDETIEYRMNTGTELSINVTCGLRPGIFH